MTMTDQSKDDLALDQFFSAARKSDLAPDAALIARVLMDADRVQGLHAYKPAAVAALGGAGTGWLGMIGGWPSLSGLAAATVAGVWIGFAPPASLSDVTSVVLGDSLSVSVFSVETLLGTEG